MRKSLTIFIVGTTAVGKTRLSLELAKHLGGQIISCDSKQLYKHANILTAKATKQQSAIAKHHMIDCLELNETTYNRNKYFNQAMKCIEEIRIKGKVPIVIGGTNYYLETILYDIQINQELNLQEEKKEPIHKQQLEAISQLTTNQKYENLKIIDPKMAQKLHANDDVRITSFLKKFYMLGIIPSEDYKPYVHQLRNPHTILFWIKNSNKDQQRQLIKNRIHKMLDHHGLKQILAIYTYIKNNKIQSGIMQTIGYKQFDTFYNCLKLESKSLDYQDIYKEIEEQFPTLQLNKQQLKKCQQLLIKNTNDYAKRQITWIKNRLFDEKHEQNFFILDIAGENTLEQRFIEQIRNKSVEIIDKIESQGFGSIKQKQEYFEKKHQNFEDWKKMKCQICKTQSNGNYQWNSHLASKKHKRNVKYHLKGKNALKKQDALKDKQGQQQEQQQKQEKKFEKQQQQ